MTARFLELYARPPPLSLRTLFVPGIFTRWYPGYFARVARGTPGFHPLAIDTEATRAEVARAVRDAVLAERGQVLLAGHSKGPLDAHAALVLFPEIVPRVRALVSLQACFHGTPLAENPPWFAPRSYAELGYSERAAFLAEHPEVPVPCVALSTTTAHAGWPLERTRRFIVARTGQASDGFVAERDAGLPGARMVRLEGLDHASLALPWMRGRPPFDPVRVVHAMLALATLGP